MLLLDKPVRVDLWRRLIEILERYADSVHLGRVTPELDPEAIRALLAPVDFSAPVDPEQALQFVADNLWRFQTHTPHPRYYGLFNPAPTTMGIAADALVAAFNPQLAAWSHSPLAVEIEQHLIRHLGVRFGYDPVSAAGAFASGGAEANHTAVLTALTHAFPDFARLGARGLPADPVFYASTESHHSFLKAARLCGLGWESLRNIPVTADLAMDKEALRSAIRVDREQGRLPFLVVATAGTTSAGVVDPLPSVASVAGDEGLWFHVDAAWGGAAAIDPQLRPLLAGIERADSISFDAHKWLSVPMGAGLYLTRHPDILRRTFHTATAYMPREAAGLDVIDPHLESMQWSRRFTGLKVFLSLMVAGWAGYGRAIRHMTAMGQLLRSELERSGWEVVNRTPLPVVCFRDRSGADPAAVVRRVVGSGEAWISTTLLPVYGATLRACITNYRTQADDIHALIESLDHARRETLSA